MRMESASLKMRSSHAEQSFDEAVDGGIVQCIAVDAVAAVEGDVFFEGDGNDAAAVVIAKKRRHVVIHLDSDGDGLIIADQLGGDEGIVGGPDARLTELIQSSPAAVRRCWCPDRKAPADKQAASAERDCFPAPGDWLCSPGQKRCK